MKLLLAFILIFFATRQVASQDAAKVTMTPALIKHCQEVDRHFKKWGWQESKCSSYPWLHVRDSVLGKPLFWSVFGDEAASTKGNVEVTMIMCGVHGDEITPVKFCFDAMKYLQENKAIYQDKLVVVAPIVNPDSFLTNKPSRVNHNGVDINRNFPTADWNKAALKYWKSYKSDKRRYPGDRALSEPEVLFQINLVKRYNPDKIISVHAPLTLLDYDGPPQKEDGTVEALATELLIQMSKDASGYRIKDYPFYPGSLGNWAGNERKIPTYTLELPSSDPKRSQEFWDRLKSAIHTALSRDFRRKKQADI